MYWNPPGSSTHARQTRVPRARRHARRRPAPAHHPSPVPLGQGGEAPSPSRGTSSSPEARPAPAGEGGGAGWEGAGRAWGFGRGRKGPGGDARPLEDVWLSSVVLLDVSCLSGACSPWLLGLTGAISGPGDRGDRGDLRRETRGRGARGKGEGGRGVAGGIITRREGNGTEESFGETELGWGPRAPQGARVLRGGALWHGAYGGRWPRLGGLRCAGAPPGATSSVDKRRALFPRSLAHSRGYHIDADTPVAEWGESRPSAMGDDPSCPVCLSDYGAQREGRVLPCPGRHAGEARRRPPEPRARPRPSN